MTREEDLSTVEAGAQAAARLSRPDGDGRRPQGHRSAPGARAQAPLGLISRAAWVRTRRETALGRLTKRPEFLAAATGRRFHTERLSLQGRRRDGAESLGGLRIGFTITKRVGHATERNRIKRRLRAAMGEAGADGAAVPIDLVVIGRRDALAAEYSTLVDDLRRAIHVLTKPKPDRGPRRDGPGPREPRHPSTPE